MRDRRSEKVREIAQRYSRVAIARHYLERCDEVGNTNPRTNWWLSLEQQRRTVMMSIFPSQYAQILTWQQFARKVRSKGCNLLHRLDEFPNSVLVTGCQRSGTTALARIIRASDGMVEYRRRRDDELDAALILSGYEAHTAQGRYCFQTTYLNECYPEYFRNHNGHKIIWLVRNPFSVVYSMIRNWERFAFDELFEACGVDMLSPKEKARFERFGKLGISRTRRACASYAGKVSQVFELCNGLGSDQIMVVEYDELVLASAELLPRIYDFIGLPYKREYSRKLHKNSLDKLRKLSERQRRKVEHWCIPTYVHVRELLGDGRSSCASAR